MGDEAGAASILGANFSAGFAAGSIAAAATCPLDVARTRRQIEVIPCPHSLYLFFFSPMFIMFFSTQNPRIPSFSMQYKGCHI